MQFKLLVKHTPRALWPVSDFYIVFIAPVVVVVVANAERFIKHIKYLVVQFVSTVPGILVCVWLEEYDWCL